MKTKYSGTKTEENLKKALAGESEARNKYTFFASKAKKDGYEQIAAIFEETANNEKEHAKMWYKELHGGEVEDTMTNLEAAAEGEKSIEELEEAEDLSAIPQIAIDDFAKSDIRVGEVKACEKVKKSKKLLQFTIFDGAGERTIVSGIAKYYQPEELVGKKILFVSNLKPVKLCGVESHGMILSAVHGEGDNEQLKVITVDESLPAGWKIC